MVCEVIAAFCSASVSCLIRMKDDDRRWLPNFMDEQFDWFDSVCPCTRMREIPLNILSCIDRVARVGHQQGRQFYGAVTCETATVIFGETYS